MIVNRKVWAWWTLFFVIGGLLVSCGDGDGDGEAEPATTPVPGVSLGEAEIAVDAVSGGTVDATRTVTGTGPFEVDVVIVSTTEGYQGYQYKLRWDEAVLAYDGQTDLKPADLDLCATPTVRGSTVYGGCVRVSDNTTFTGPVNTLTLHCLSTGTSPLHLMTRTEDPHFGSGTLGFAGVSIPTTLTDASVTCAD